jgi:hypothetical protein
VNWSIKGEQERKRADNRAKKSSSWLMSRELFYWHTPTIANSDGNLEAAMTATTTSRKTSEEENAPMI